MTGVCILVRQQISFMKKNNRLYKHNNNFNVCTQFLGQTITNKKGHSRVYPEPGMFPTFPVRSMEQHDADLQV